MWSDSVGVGRGESTSTSGHALDVAVNVQMASEALFPRVQLNHDSHSNTRSAGLTGTDPVRYPVLRSYCISSVVPEHDTAEYDEHPYDLEEAANDDDQERTDICEDDGYDYSPLEDTPDQAESVERSCEPDFEARRLLERLQEKRVLQAIRIFTAERCMKRMRLDSSPTAEESVGDNDDDDDDDNDKLLQELFEHPITYPDLDASDEEDTAASHPTYPETVDTEMTDVSDTIPLLPEYTAQKQVLS